MNEEQGTGNGERGTRSIGERSRPAAPTQILAAALSDFRLPTSDFELRTSNVLPPLLRHLAFGNFPLPFIFQWPINGAGTEVGHMQIRPESLDGRTQQLIILTEDGTMAGQ